MNDLIIVGGGPAGLSAAIYAARYKIKTLLISKNMGGMMVDAHWIENYPGIQSISGYELAKKMEQQVKNLGVEIINDEVLELKKEKNGIKVSTSKEKYIAKSIILALGTQRRKLNCNGEKEYLGKGVSYCATCDAPFFKEKIVGVVGGNDAAVHAAILLSEYAKEVYIIYRKEKIRAEPYNIENMKKKTNIKVINNTNVVEIKGDGMMNKVVFDNGKEFKLDGLFIEIGGVPSTALALNIGVKTDKEGFILINCEQETNLPGVYAAGDITIGCNKLMQVITACAEGAIAANSVFNFLKKVV